MIEIRKTFRFEASHILPKHPGKCARLHGHSWELEVAIIGKVNSETGFVADYGDLKALVEEPIIRHLDHSHLGCGNAYTTYEPKVQDVWHPYLGVDFYPSSENLVVAFVRILQPLVKELSHGSTELSEVTLKETCTSTATWRAERRADQTDRGWR